MPNDEWLFPDIRPFWAHDEKEKDVASTHEYRVGKRRMAQFLALPTTTTVKEIRKKWESEGYEWVKPDDFYHAYLDEREVMAKKPVKVTDHKLIVSNDPKPTIIAETYRVDLTEEATTMPTKKKTPKTEETAVTKNDQPISEKRQAAIAKRQAEIDELRGKYDAPAFNDPINFHNVLKVEGTDKKPAGLWVTDVEREYLCWISNERGWTNNAFATKNQVMACHGTIPEGAEGVTLYSPKGTPATYYNYDQAVWEGDGPAYDKEITRQQGKERREKRAARKPKATTNELDDLRRENAEIKEMLAQLMAKLG